MMFENENAGGVKILSLNFVGVFVLNTISVKIAFFLENQSSVLI